MLLMLAGQGARAVEWESATACVCTLVLQHERRGRQTVMMLVIRGCARSWKRAACEAQRR